MGTVFFHAPRGTRRLTRIRIVMGLRRMAFCTVLAGVAALGEPDMARAHSSSPADPCLSFLSPGYSQGSSELSDRHAVSSAQAAGKAATLSLLLGVRLALGPTEDLNGKQTTKKAPDVSALDIARYRTCKKDQALRVSALP